MKVDILDADDQLKDSFAIFLDNNPLSEPCKVIFDDMDDKDCRIAYSWGDPSLHLFIHPSDRAKAEDMLNKIKLPPLLSAILHLDCNSL